MKMANSPSSMPMQSERRGSSGRACARCRSGGRWSALRSIQWRRPRRSRNGRSCMRCWSGVARNRSPRRNRSKADCHRLKSIASPSPDFLTRTPVLPTIAAIGWKLIITVSSTGYAGAAGSFPLLKLRRFVKRGIARRITARSWAAGTFHAASTLSISRILAPTACTAARSIFLPER